MWEYSASIFGGLFYNANWLLKVLSVELEIVLGSATLRALYSNRQSVFQLDDENACQ
jgi:hypothetical protein